MNWQVGKNNGEDRPQIILPGLLQNLHHW
jgi:hypothetical protein